MNDTHRHARRGGLYALVFCFLLLAGCSGNDKKQEATPTADASATAAALAMSAGPSPTPTTTPSPTFGDVVWTTSVDAQTKAPTEPVDLFTTDARTIYATLLVRYLPPNTVLTADWTYNATSLDGLTTSAVVTSRTEEHWVEFHLTRSDEPWPDGTYAIAISVEGEVVRSAEVEVEKG